MRIREKINMDRDALIENGPINIVAFGDSVTHGAVGDGETDYESVYWNRLKKKINAYRPFVPVNVINAGIGGLSASTSVARMESQVLSHSPDLVIICFGLNDVNGTLEKFLEALKIMFEKCKERDIETIFMTPNMLNTYVREGEVAECYLNYAKKTAEYQNGGRMDLFMSKAVELANEMGVLVCDCYARWKELSLKEDTTLLLANRINHPIREMHELFAESLFELIFRDSNGANEMGNVMYTK